jgi:hypothetical protein
VGGEYKVVYVGYVLNDVVVFEIVEKLFNKWWKKILSIGTFIAK